LATTPVVVMLMLVVLVNLRSLVDNKVIGISAEIPLEFTNRVEFTVQ